MKKTYLILITVVAVIIGYTLVTGLIDKQNAVIKERDNNRVKNQTVMGPVFDEQKAFDLIKKQCSYGPRVINTEAHRLCGEWIEETFKSYGMVVTPQQMTLEGYDGVKLNCKNIIAQYCPERVNRILLCAHWDSRPWADNDPDEKNHHTPIDGANDGASGVAVMLEIARLLSADTTLRLGVDFVCFDAEDRGTPQWEKDQSKQNTWALGSQYYAQNLVGKHKPAFGILLDMVGGKGAVFYREVLSDQYASDVVDKIYAAARALGYESYFPRQQGGMIEDDHVAINTVAQIPTADIIPFYPECPQSSFGPTWHTVQDNVQNIDPSTLKAVGQTLIQLLYQENLK